MECESVCVGAAEVDGLAPLGLIDSISTTPATSAAYSCTNTPYPVSRPGSARPARTDLAHRRRSATCGVRQRSDRRCAGKRTGFAEPIPARSYVHTRVSSERCTQRRVLTDSDFTNADGLFRARRSCAGQAGPTRGVHVRPGGNGLQRTRSAPAPPIASLSTPHVLSGAGVPGPYVLVGHSLAAYRTLFVHEYARGAGVVLIESMSRVEPSHPPRPRDTDRLALHCRLGPPLPARTGVLRLVSGPLHLDEGFLRR